MIRSVHIAARFAGFPPALAFTVDDDTLALGGPDADAVRGLMDAATADGSVSIEPHPTSVAITDPLRDRMQFAAVLAQAYDLPDWLRDWIPEDDDAGDDSLPGDLRPIY